MSTGGQALGGLVGGFAGFFLGGPTGAMYGAQLGLMVGGYLDPPKGPTVNGPRLDDLSVQTSTYGAVIPRVYGTVTVDGNVLWLENNAIKETVTKKKSGGKGGGSKTTTRTYTYSATFAVGLCKGPIIGVRRIWVGPDLYYDAGTTDPGTIQASNDAATGFRLYTGTDTQSADARMQATLGVANTPAWRGLAYIVFSDLPLAKYGNSLMGAQVRVELMKVAAVYDYPLTEHASATPIKQWSRPAWNGRVFCAIDKTQTTSNKTCLTSADGITWTSYNLPVVGGDNTDWLDIAASTTGTFIAVRFWNYTNQLARSTDDGQTWSWVSLPSTGSPFRICYGNGRFVITCSGAHSRAYVSSDDGVSWSAYTLPRAPGYSGYVFYSATFGKYYIAVYDGGVSYILSSSDGSTWSDTVVVTSTGWNWFVELNGTLVLYNKSSATGDLRSTNGSTWTQTTGTGGYFGVATDGKELIFIKGDSYLRTSDLTTFTEISFTTYGGAIWATPCWSGAVFSVLSESAETRCLTIVRQMVAPATEVLSSVVLQECLWSGLLTAGDIDVTALISTVRGYRIGTVGAIRSALEPLQAAWPFDVRQHGYKIQFVARGGASVVTIPAADLDARGPGDAPGVQITTSREMDSQLSRRVTVQHLDYDREYDIGTQYAERLNTSAINSLRLDLPIVLTATEAAGKAEVLLYLYWLERYDVTVALPPTYNQLEPGDVVTLVTPEGNVSLRLTSVHNTSDGRVECQAKYANAAIYTPTAVGASPAVTGPVTLTPVGASVYVLLDLPEISTSQNTPCFLAAMTGALTGWGGGALMQSTDAGSTWADLHDFGAPGCTMGSATNSIGAVDTGIMDNASILSVTLTQGELSSVTQLAMFSGANHFAYGSDGRWEIIAAMTATLASGSNYTLSNLLRGRFGTEQYMGSHSISDSIILLDTTDIALIAMGLGTIGLSYLYRGITISRDIGTDSNRSWAYNAVNLKPLAPIYLTGNRDASNDWALTWIRRTRDGGEWRDNVDAALGEAIESYQIDIYSDGTYTTVKRTLATSAPSAAYTSADQNTDFGANQAILYLKLYQISATVGRGYPLTKSITR